MRPISLSAWLRRQGMGEVRRADLGQRHFQPTQLPHQRRQAELPAEHHQHQDRQQATEGDPHLGVLDTVGARAHQRDQVVQLCPTARWNTARSRADRPGWQWLCHLVEHGPERPQILPTFCRWAAISGAPSGSRCARHCPHPDRRPSVRTGRWSRPGPLGRRRRVAIAASRVHILAEHALRAGHVDGLRRDRHAQVQRHRGAGGQAEHQCIGQQELGVQGSSTRAPVESDRTPLATLSFIGFSPLDYRNR